jgi:hypothetical protein
MDGLNRNQIGIPKLLRMAHRRLSSCEKRAVSDNSNCWTSDYPYFLLFIFRALKLLSPHTSNKTHLQLMNIYLNCIIENILSCMFRLKKANFRVIYIK